MPGQQAIKAGKAFIEFVLSDKKVGGQLARIGAKMQKIGGIGLAVSGPLTAAFAAMAFTFASVGDELNKLSDRTGLSVENLSELKFAALQSDVTLEDLAKAFRELQDKGIDPIHFDQIAADLAAIEDPTERADRAMELFGKRAGTALLPMLKDLPMLREQARSLGLTLSGDAADSATKLGDEFNTVTMQVQALAVQIGAAIAGPLTEFLMWAQQILSNVIAFVQENPNLVAAIAAVTVGIAAASAAAVTLGVILAVISAHPIIAALTVIAGLVLGVATYFGLASDAAGDFKSSLDGVKMPGASPSANLTEQSRQVQNQLQSALSGSPVRQAAAASPASDPAVRAVSVRDYLPDIAKATRETADGIKQLVRIGNTTPFGLLAQVLP